MPVEPGEWERIVAENPDHSRWYIQRFRDRAAAGDDSVGEARLIDAMVPRRSRILDAGCGPGRVGGFLHSIGHDVVGVFMKNWEDDDTDLHCTSREDLIDAAAVADVIGIELEVVNFSADSTPLRQFEHLRTTMSSRH